MNRRNVLKLLISTGLIFGASKYFISNKKFDSVIANEQDFTIIPKQTSKYIFSAPLPLDFDSILRLKEINSKFKKSKIATLYNSIPFSSNLDIYHSPRGENKKVQNIDTFLKYVTFAKKNGFNFVYTLNSPNPFLESEYQNTKKDLFKLINKLRQAGCNNFKIGNTQLLTILTKEFPSLNLSASTAFSFNSVAKYDNLLKQYPKIKHIDIDTDENRNFKFLLTMKKLFPNVELELLVNDPCIRGCPGKIPHISSEFCVFDCWSKRSMYKELCKSGVIYPWYLEYYSAIGINNFKLISRPRRAVYTDVTPFETYLEIVENGNVDIISAKKFFEENFRNLPFENDKIRLSDIMEDLPDINHFIKNGHKCADACGRECDYCGKRAKKLQSKLEKA